MERPGIRGRDERQVDFRGLSARQFDLGFLRALLESLQGHRVGGQIDSVFVLELGDQPVDDRLVPVVAAELSVAGCGLDLEHSFANLEHGDVERPTPQIEHEDCLVMGFLVEAVRQRGGSRLVDDAEHLEAGDGAGLFGGLALGVTEIRGDGDNRLGDGCTQERLGVSLELLQNAGGDLLSGVILTVEGHRPVGAHSPFDRLNGAVGVGYGLSLGNFSDEDLPVFGEGDNRGRCAVPFGIGDDRCLAPFHGCDDAVGCTQVDSYGSSHVSPQN